MSLPVRSLSMTAFTPQKTAVIPGYYRNPAAGADDNHTAFDQNEITDASRISSGLGEATTRRHLLPPGAICLPRSLAACVRLSCRRLGL